MSLHKSTLAIFVICTFFLLTSAFKPCSKQSFPSAELFASCIDLPRLNGSLHWTRSHSSAICIAFRAPQNPDGWIAWGLNLEPDSMLGPQVLVALRGLNGSMMAYPTKLGRYMPKVKAEELRFPVYRVSAEYHDGEMILFGTLGVLGGGGGVGGAKFNHVWQKGYSIVHGVPTMHSVSADNLFAKGTVEFH